MHKPRHLKTLAYGASLALALALAAPTVPGDVGSGGVAYAQGGSGGQGGQSGRLSPSE